MEGGSITAYKAIKSYWQRRGYEKLADSVQPPSQPGRRRSRGRRRRRRRGFWRRVRVTPRVKILKFFASPKKFLLFLRDAYVKMMLGFANSSLFSTGSGYYCGGGGEASGIGQGYSAGFSRAPLKEYDQRMIVEIYRSVVAAQGKLAGCDAAGKLGSSCPAQPRLEWPR